MVQRRREADEGGVGIGGEGCRRKLVLCDLQKAGRQAQETFDVQDGGAGGCSCCRNVSCIRKERGKRCFLFAFTFNICTPIFNSFWQTWNSHKVFKNAAWARLTFNRLLLDAAARWGCWGRSWRTEGLRKLHFRTGGTFNWTGVFQTLLWTQVDFYWAILTLQINL